MEGLGAEEMRCVLFSGGPVEDFDQVPFRLKAGDYVISCDRGYEAAQRFGVRPHLMVGDFDSYHGPVDPAVPVHTVPARKDDTDTLLGARIGLEKGYREFLILGGFGGRLDHTVANLQTLCFLAEQGAKGEIRANRNRAWVVRNGELALEPMEGWHISVFAADGPCEGVTLEGLSYPLQNYRMVPSFPIGVSNEFTGVTAHIWVDQGTLLVIASREV